MQKKAILAALLIALSPAPALAGGGGLSGMSTEITQLANNVELGLQSMQAEMQTLEMIEQTYLAQLQRLQADLGQFSAPFQRGMDVYNTVRTAQRTLSIFRGRVEDLQGMLEHRSRQLGASNLGWNDWLQREGNLIREGDERARAQVTANAQVLAGVDDSMQAYSQAAEALRGTVGTHQATQLVGVSVGILGRDVASLLAVTAQGQALAGEKAVEDEAIRKRAIDEAAAREAAQRALNARRTAELEALLNRQRRH